jgi:murein DD-endopeptidase MepM/ murein hydrolase activator NlpD
MRVLRISRLAVFPWAVALFLAGCAAGRVFHPRTEPGGTVYRNFQWPVPGTIASGFGGRGGQHHNGIDILAPEGTPVRASETGLVVYAGDGLRGYGNAAMLDHGGGATTLYGHLMEIHVKSGDVVAAGSVIGTVGRTGNATTTHLHFELRLEGRSVNPSDYLPRMEEPR